MSAALERVIAEQQAEIDRMRKQQIQRQEYSVKDFEAKEEIFTRAAQMVDWYKLRECWKDDKKQEWSTFMTMRNDLRIAIVEYGYCICCKSLTCAGECHDS